MKGDKVRNEYLQKVIEYFSSLDEDVLVIGSNAICFPAVDETQDDIFIRIKVEVPKGSKDEPFDGYTMAEDWQMKLEEKRIKEEKKKAEKERKKARDKKERELKAKIKEKKSEKNS